jgi:hypothetical protein
VGSNLHRLFSRMGARVSVLEAATVLARFRRWPFPQDAPQIVIDICRDQNGEFFEIRTAPGSRQELDVLNSVPQEKHLVLLSRQFDAQGKTLAKQKFLCGRDEKHWFVAAIPESEPVSTVASARIALKLEEVRTASRRWEFPAKKVCAAGTRRTFGKGNGFFFLNPT